MLAKMRLQQAAFQAAAEPEASLPDAAVPSSGLNGHAAATGHIPQLQQCILCEQTTSDEGALCLLVSSVIRQAMGAWRV